MWFVGPGPLAGRIRHDLGPEDTCIDYLRARGDLRPLRRLLFVRAKKMMAKTAYLEYKASSIKDTLSLSALQHDKGAQT